MMMGDLAELPPTEGPVGDGTAQERLSAQDAGVPPGILAPLEDLTGITAGAEAAGNAWQESIGPLLDSPAGYGSDGFEIEGDHPTGADGNWPSSMAFEHEGP